jgi:hypothetical protein
MKKLKKNIIITIIAILALFMIFAKPTYGLLNIDEDQSAVESQLGKDLELGASEDEGTTEGNPKTVEDIINENEKNKLLEGAKKLITIDTMLFNEEPLVDINFFNDSEAVKEIKEKNPKAFIIQIREGIKTWYYVLRNIAIMVMVIVLMYVAIRMLLNMYTESPENKARYKEMMIAWIKALSTLIIMHIVIYTVIAFNTDIIETIKDVAHIDDPRLQNLNVILLERALDIRLSISFPATILYVMVTFLTIQYFFVYLKRFILVLILIISGPFIIVKTAYESTGKSVSKTYSKWLYDLIINVMEQSIHALFYALFVRSLFEGAMENLLGFLIFWFVLKSMLKLSATVIKLFKFNSKSGSVGSMPAERGKGLMTFAKFQLAKKTFKSYASITTKPAKAIATTLGGFAYTAGISGAKLITNKLSINNDINDPNKELMRDKIDKVVLGNPIVSKHILHHESPEETEQLLDVRKDARRETESSKYSKELSKKYTKEKIGNFTANVATTAKINAMKAARILGVPFALIKDLTDGEDISFSTLELLKMTDWKKVKKDYDKKHEKSNKKIEKYKKQINAHGETIKDKTKIRSEYRELLAERRRRNNINDNNRNERISAEDIKRKLRRIHYLDINTNSLDKIVKKQMAELNIENKEDLTTTKINLILDRVIEKSKMDYNERQTALEKLSRNRFVDSENNEEQNEANNSSSRRPDNVIVISQTAAAINRQNIEQNQELRNVGTNEETLNNEPINNNQTINDVNQETPASNRRENTEERIDINDISEARAKREGSRYIAEELSRILTSVIAEDENIAKIGNSINTLKDSNEKRKSKLNVNKFIDNL